MQYLCNIFYAIFNMQILCIILYFMQYFCLFLHLILRNVSCILLLNDMYSTFLTHLRHSKFFTKRHDRMPARNLVEGTQNFCALGMQPWYDLLFMLKSHCECTYYCLINLGIPKWMEHCLFSYILLIQLKKQLEKIALDWHSEIFK